MRNLFRIMMISLGLLLTSCNYYCSEDDTIELISNSYRNNKEIFDRIPGFLLTNDDNVQSIEYYNYEFIINFKNQDRNTVYIEKDSIEKGLEDNGFDEIASLKGLIDLMNKENLEYISIDSQDIIITSYCGNNIKDSKIFLKYDFHDKLEYNNAIIHLDNNWLIIKK